MRFSPIFFLVILATIGVARAQDNDHKGQIAQELVGKWCYLPRTAETTESMTNSCITLNADGTYDIAVDQSAMNSAGTSFSSMSSSDAGTWWVEGNLLWYNSNSRGKGSYRFQKANHPRLEKTPVILVEGVIFCSATPRDPW